MDKSGSKADQTRQKYKKYIIIKEQMEYAIATTHDLKITSEGVIQ